MANWTQQDYDGAKSFVLFWLIVGLVWIVHLQFQNLDMTRLRFFVTFWPLELAWFAGYAAYVLLKHKESQHELGRYS